jgi:hypothetical protein
VSFKDFYGRISTSSELIGMSERWSAGQGLQACAKCREQKLIHGLSFRQAIFQLNKSSGFYGATSFNKTLG